MVLSNAERQARFQKRLRERAASGVTPEMVIKAAKLTFDYWVRSEVAFDGDLPTWEKILADARKSRRADLWQQWVPVDCDDDYSDFGDDAPTMRAVAQVAAAVLRPPDAD